MGWDSGAPAKLLHLPKTHQVVGETRDLVIQDPSLPLTCRTQGAAAAIPINHKQSIP